MNKISTKGFCKVIVHHILYDIVNDTMVIAAM